MKRAKRRVFRHSLESIMSKVFRRHAARIAENITSHNSLIKLLTELKK